MSEVSDGGFNDFVSMVEPVLRRALVAQYGHERGREAAAEALAYAWEHWEDVSTMSNPAGYLYRVGQSRTRPRRQRVLFDRRFAEEPLVEPGLPDALARLSPKQRVAVVLVHAFQRLYVSAAANAGALGDAFDHCLRGSARHCSETANIDFQVMCVRHAPLHVGSQAI